MTVNAHFDDGSDDGDDFDDGLDHVDDNDD